MLAQKYLRKAGVPAILRKVKEKGVPTWLQRSEPDHEKLQSLDPEKRFIGESHGRDYSVVWLERGHIGDGSMATSKPKQTQEHTLTKCAT